MTQRTTGSHKIMIAINRRKIDEKRQNISTDAGVFEMSPIQCGNYVTKYSYAIFTTEQEKSKRSNGVKSAACWGGGRRDGVSAI